MMIDGKTEGMAWNVTGMLEQTKALATSLIATAPPEPVSDVAPVTQATELYSNTPVGLTGTGGISIPELFGFSDAQPTPTVGADQLMALQLALEREQKKVQMLRTILMIAAAVWVFKKL